MKPMATKWSRGAVSAALLLGAGALHASSHMDAPLITFDDAANTTDVYAFRSDDGETSYLSTALAVYPFEEPGIGPNKYNFDDNVRYTIHVALGDDVQRGQATISYHFDFNTRFKNKRTILQSFLGVINDVDDANQNLTQTYKVTRVDHRSGQKKGLGTGVVPPNNQGRLTPFYNQENDGDNPARDGVATEGELDRYTQQTIARLAHGYLAFAGQRDDGFYADIQSIFDLDFTFGGPNKPFDSQGGYNVHTIVLNIPLAELGGDQQVAGVYATTARRQVAIEKSFDDVKRKRSLVRKFKKTGGTLRLGKFVQVGRQGNPLFNEGFVALEAKDLYNRSTPADDRRLFSRFALEPELAAALGLPDNLRSNRTDIAAIFIPDLIKVDLSTAAARLAGGGPSHPVNPDDPGFSRLSVFGGDVLTSRVQAGLPGLPAGTIPGGWPNGRRFGDDVVDIGVTALASDLRVVPLQISAPIGDRVDANDIAYNKIFPYAATPLNGRSHAHH